MQCMEMELWAKPFHSNYLSRPPTQTLKSIKLVRNQSEAVRKSKEKDTNKTEKKLDSSAAIYTKRKTTHTIYSVTLP